jgi:hypothetical protein
MQMFAHSGGFAMAMGVVLAKHTSTFSVPIPTP